MTLYDTEDTELYASCAWASGPFGTRLASGVWTIRREQTLKRRLTFVALLLSVCALLGAPAALSAPSDGHTTGNACPHDDRTPPNCGQNGDHGGGNGDNGNACPDASHNPDGTPPNCGNGGGGNGGGGGGTCPPSSPNAGNPPPCGGGGGGGGGGGCEATDTCPPPPPTSAAGPCHRSEGILGAGGLGIGTGSQANPLAEQVQHGVEPLTSPLGLPIPEHPGADEAASATDNSSLGASLAQPLYESGLPLQLGQEAGCATDLVGI
jgi:hypothetical protein